MKNLSGTEAQWLHEAIPWGKDAGPEAFDTAVHGYWMKADAG